MLNFNQNIVLALHSSIRIVVSGNALQIKLCPADFAFKLGPATQLFKGQSLFDLDTAFLGLEKEKI